VCVRAHNDYMRDFRAAKYAAYQGAHPDGRSYSSSTYNNYSCRCKDCTEAHRVDMRAYLDRKKAEREQRP